jgi:hypothetical protein
MSKFSYEEKEVLSKNISLAKKEVYPQKNKR